MKKFVFTATMVLCLMLTASAFALEHCRSQTIFVQALCNDFRTSPTDNVRSYTRLIIYNVDPDNGITLHVDFLSPSQGPDDEPAASFDPVYLNPWESHTYFVTNSGVSSDFQCGAGYLADERPKFIVEWASTKWVVPPSIRGAAGITHLVGDSHSETLSEGIVIDGRCR